MIPPLITTFLEVESPIPKGCGVHRRHGMEGAGGRVITGPGVLSGRGGLWKPLGGPGKDRGSGFLHQGWIKFSASMSCPLPTSTPGTLDFAVPPTKGRGDLPPPDLAQSQAQPRVSGA